jgi:hypothetical protein
MLKKIILTVAVGSVAFWFWSIRPEPSRTLDHFLENCESGQCETTLWVEGTLRKHSFLSKFEREEVSTIDTIANFPDYLGCAYERGKRVVALEDQLRKDGISVQPQTAKRLTPLPEAGSVSVIADDGLKSVKTYTFFCGYRSLVPDRRDSPGLFPFIY